MSANCTHTFLKRCKDWGQRVTSARVQCYVLRRLLGLGDAVGNFEVIEGVARHEHAEPAPQTSAC